MPSIFQSRKRQKLRADRVDEEVEDLGLARKRNEQKLEGRFSAIYAKYGRDFCETSDVVDLFTGAVLEDRGHLQRMRHERDVGTQRPRASFNQNDGKYSDAEDDELAASQAEEIGRSVWEVPEEDEDDDHLESTSATLAAQIVKAAWPAGHNGTAPDADFVENFSQKVVDQVAQVMRSLGSSRDNSSSTYGDSLLSSSMPMPFTHPVLDLPAKNTTDISPDGTPLQNSEAEFKSNYGLERLDLVRTAQLGLLMNEEADRKSQELPIERNRKRKSVITAPPRTVMRAVRTSARVETLKNAETVKTLETGRTSSLRSSRTLRDTKSLAEEFAHEMPPPVVNEKWSNEEESLLLGLITREGEDYRAIADHFPKRHAKSIERHFDEMIKPKHKCYKKALEARAALAKPCSPCGETLTVDKVGGEDENFEIVNYYIPTEVPASTTKNLEMATDVIDEDIVEQKIDTINSMQTAKDNIAGHDGQSHDLDTEIHTEPKDSSHRDPVTLLAGNEDKELNAPPLAVAIDKDTVLLPLDNHEHDMGKRDSSPNEGEIVKLTEMPSPNITAEEHYELDYEVVDESIEANCQARLPELHLPYSIKVVVNSPGTVCENNLERNCPPSIDQADVDPTEMVSANEADNLIQSAESFQPTEATEDNEDELASAIPSPLSLGSPDVQSVSRHISQDSLGNASTFDSPLSIRIRHFKNGRASSKRLSSITGKPPFPTLLKKRKHATLETTPQLPTPCPSSPRASIMVTGKLTPVRKRRFALSTSLSSLTGSPHDQSCHASIEDSGSDDELGH